jgi:hypothetical protein
MSKKIYNHYTFSIVVVKKHSLSIHPTNGIKAQIFYHEKNKDLSEARNTGIKATHLI